MFVKKKRQKDAPPALFRREENRPAIDIPKDQRIIDGI
jgi:hypothetical protein